jgi:hypothetical protein
MPFIMRVSVLQCALIMCCVCTRVYSTSFVTTRSGGDIATPIRSTNETSWVSRVSLTQASDSIVLVLLADVGQNGYEPCTEFGPVCCLGLQLRDSVWGGDVAILDDVRRACRVQGGEPWATVLAPLKSRNYSDVQFTLDDMNDPWRALRTPDGISRVRVLVLVVRRWSGCLIPGEDACVLGLQVTQQTFEVDTHRTQQSATVSLPALCTRAKPEHALWFASTTTCEWFCEPGFIQCFGNSTDSAGSCSPLPVNGAVLKSTMAVTWVSTENIREQASVNLLNQELIQGPFDVEGVFGNLSTAVVTRMKAAGVVGIDGCGVIFREIRSTVTREVDLSVVDEPVRIEKGLYYNGVGLQDTPTLYPSTKIPVELPDVDDRLLPGYSEFTVLVYSGDVLVPLAHQAVLMRYVLIDSLIANSNVESVLYVSEVRGTMNTQHNSSHTEISIGEFIGLLLWASSLIAVITTALFCPQWYPRKTNTESLDGVDTKTTLQSTDSCTQSCSNPTCCAQHSPRDRTLIVVLLALVVCTILGSASLYVFVIIPQLQLSTADERPLLTIGWFWCVFVVSILLVVGFCFIAAGVRRLRR